MTEAQLIHPRIVIDHDSQEIIGLKLRFGFRCLKCGRSELELGERLAIDHVLPLSKGGPNSVDNYQPLCRQCNSGKHNRLGDYRDSPHTLCIQDSGKIENDISRSPEYRREHPGPTVVVRLSDAALDVLNKIKSERGFSTISEAVFVLLENNNIEERIERLEEQIALLRKQQGGAGEGHSTSV